MLFACYVVSHHWHPYRMLGYLPYAVLQIIRTYALFGRNNRLLGFLITLGLTLLGLSGVSNLLVESYL